MHFYLHKIFYTLFELLEGEEIKFPTPAWVNQNKKQLEFINNSEAIVTKEKISALRLNKVPYDTVVDIILLDEFGNTKVLEKNKEIEKNKVTYISFNESVLDDFYGSDHRKFILVTNNRGNDLLADVLAFENKKKPFPTSFQRILEIYPFVNESS